MRLGLWSGKAPLGYSNTTLSNGKKCVIPDPIEKNAIQAIFNWFAIGAYSLRIMTQKVLEDFGIKYQMSQVEHVVKNPFYYGEMKLKGKNYPHGYDTLISKELFDQAQTVREGYKKKHFKYAGLPYYYRGLIRCAECGCVITPEKKDGPSGKTYVYYHCTQHFGKHGAEWVSDADLTEQLSNIFDSFKVPEDVIEDIVKTLITNHSEKIKMYDTTLSQLQSEHRRYETMIETIYEDRVIGRITPEQYDKKCIEYRAKQEQLIRKMVNLQMADEC